MHVWKASWEISRHTKLPKGKDNDRPIGMWGRFVSQLAAASLDKDNKNHPSARPSCIHLFHVLVPYSSTSPLRHSNHPKQTDSTTIPVEAFSLGPKVRFPSAKFRIHLLDPYPKRCCPRQVLQLEKPALTRSSTRELDGLNWRVLP